MAEKYIAWRYFNDKRPSYVSDINTSGKGDRYGYVTDVSKALPISETEWKRFSRYMVDVGSVGFCSPAPRVANPIKRTGISKTRYVKRPSQASGKAPSKRLQARRKASPRTGMFPNPAKRDAFLYVVHQADPLGNPRYDIAKFREKKTAVEYAKAYAKQYGVPVVIESKKL